MTCLGDIRIRVIADFVFNEVMCRMLEFYVRGLEKIVAIDPEMDRFWWRR